MTVERGEVDAIRDRIGRFGVWVRGGAATPEIAGLAERLGYGALWHGGSPAPDLSSPRRLLEATEDLVVATGIVSIWSGPAAGLAEAYHALAADFPDRFLLGLGVARAERGAPGDHPVEAMSEYLDELEAAGVPGGRVVLAALGPRMLRLAARRTAGAHPYLITPAYSEDARGILGPDALLAPEQRVALGDIAAAREFGRESVRNPYLALANYRSSFRRMGFSERDLDEASDHLIDALVGRGTAPQAAARIAEHLDAGADHVAVNVLGDDRDGGLAALADVLGLRR